jgi:hypothetical protein
MFIVSQLRDNCLTNVGSMFQPNEFVDVLLKAKVNRITCFARCHHGWLYYKSERNPERFHPTLTRDLLREQIDVCQKHGIQVAVYTTVQWDHYTSEEHPEWLVVREDGAWCGPPLYHPGFNRKLCLNSPYRNFLKEHIKDILETLPTVDGLFLDIVSPVDCNCKFCRKEMEKRGLELSDPVLRWKFSQETIDQFKTEMTNWIRSFRKNVGIFYNSGHFGPTQSKTIECYTHVEVESIPSDSWGYIHFPIVARYVRTLCPGKSVVGQTGKFHTSWGDFHSYKNEAALKYECFRSLALCAQCNIGDQLHPLGFIDHFTYQLIGSVYSEVEAKEPWCRGAVPIVEVGLMNPEEFVYPLDTKENIKEFQQNLLHPSLVGAAKILEELQVQFDVLDSHSNLSPYKVIVLPDYIIMRQDTETTKRLQQKLVEFVNSGGALILSYQSGFDLQKKETVLKDLLNISVQQNYREEERHSLTPYNVDYLFPTEKLPSLSKTEYVMYRGGIAIENPPSENVEVLAHQIAPYFNRTYKHFCSHQHAPSSGIIVGAAVLHNKLKRCVYFIHPLFQIYYEKSPKWCKVLFNDVLQLVGVERVIVIRDAPSTLSATVNYQPHQNRIVVHLLHFIPLRRGQGFDVIEDVIPLFNLNCEVSTLGREVMGVSLVPQGNSVAFTQPRRCRVSFVVPSVFGHQMVAINLV